MSKIYRFFAAKVGHCSKVVPSIYYSHVNSVTAYAVYFYVSFGHLHDFYLFFLSVFVYYVCFVSFLLQLHSDSWLLKCCVKASTLDNKFVTFPTADHRTVPGVWLQTTDCIWKSNKNAPDLFSSLPMTLFEDTATRVSERWKNRCFCVTFLNDPQSLWKRRR